MELIQTEDGSQSIYLSDLDETYHSRHGAIRESMYVFIKNGLRYFLSSSRKRHINIFELGLGTGLNALLTSLEALKLKYCVHYTAIEPFPLPRAVYNQLNYETILLNKHSGIFFNKIHETKWNSEFTLNEFFILLKEKKRFEEYKIVKNRFDIIYYDAFAPNKQPSIWEMHLLAKAYNMLMPHGILVTYCSQGNFKRDLKILGFKVETLLGPPGKKEMVRATK